MLILFILATLLIHVSSPKNGVGGQHVSHGDYYPYNLTVDQLTAKSLTISWTCRGQNLQEKYEVTLKPLLASYRVVETVPHNTCYLEMDNLVPNTDYQISVTSISGKIRKRSSSLVFRTPVEEKEVYHNEDEIVDLEPGFKFPPVKLVEISLVGMALVLWAGAIVLFFHRWGKIRMLLPYQPDYKEMKQTSSTCTNCSLTPHHQCSRIQMQLQAEYGLTGVPELGPGVAVTESGCGPLRPRLNSFIGYNLSDIPIHNELRNCRRAKSAEQLPLNHFNYEDAEIDFSDF